MVRDTISLTILQAEAKPMSSLQNPQRPSTAVLPDTSKENFLKEIKKRLGDEIEVEVISESESIPPSSLDTDLFRPFRNLPKGMILDARWFRISCPGRQMAAFSEKRESLRTIYVPSASRTKNY